MVTVLGRDPLDTESSGVVEVAWGIGLPSSKDGAFIKLPQGFLEDHRATMLSIFAVRLADLLRR